MGVPSPQGHLRQEKAKPQIAAILETKERTAAFEPNYRDIWSCPGSVRRIQRTEVSLFVTGSTIVNTRSVFSNIEHATKMQVLSFQSYTLLTLQSVKDIFTTTRYAGDMIIQMDQIGVGSLLIVIVALVCVGGVVVLNSSSQFSRFGATALTGDAVSLALLRETRSRVHIALSGGPERHWNGF